MSCCSSEKLALLVKLRANKCNLDKLELPAKCTHHNVHTVSFNYLFGCLNNDALQYIVCVWGWDRVFFLFPSCCTILEREDQSFFEKCYWDSPWFFLIHTSSQLDCHFEEGTSKPACLYRVYSYREKPHTHTHTHTQGETHTHTQTHRHPTEAGSNTSTGVWWLRRGERVISLALNHLLNIGAGGDC